MDWERKFSHIIHETEANLDRVRKRLESAKNTAGVPIPSHHAKTDITDFSISASHLNQAKAEKGPPIWATLLEEKMDKQKKIIENLIETVISLQNEKENQRGLINDLQEKIYQMETRMAERGIDLNTETKLLQLKTQTSSELRELQQQVKRQSQERQSDSSNHHLRALQNEMKDSRASCKEQGEWQQRDLDHFKTKIARIENSVHQLTDQIVELDRRQKEMRSNVIDLTDSSRHNYTELATVIRDKLRDSAVTREEVSKLKSELADSLKIVAPEISQASPDTGPKLKLTPGTNRGQLADIQWRDLLSHSLSSISLDSSDSDLSSGFMPKQRLNADKSSKAIPGGLTFADSDLDSRSSSPSSLSINDL